MLVLALACAAVSLLWFGLLTLQFSAAISPDGYVYQQMARGQGGPLPFRLRALLPRVLGADGRVWQRANALAYATIGFLFPFALPTLTPLQVGFALALFLGLPGLVHANVSMPVLVDPWALASTLCVVALLAHGQVVAAVAVALVGALVKETVPVWAAVWSLSPWPLLGLLVVALAWWLTKPGPHPLRIDTNLSLILKHRRGHLTANLLVLPWGVALLGFQPTLPVLLALAVGYACLAIATDSARIYQWAFLPIVAAAATLVPMELMLPLAALHLFSPWAKVS